ncbi:conserved hypothetical protein [Kribbella flavida DSM 17836]|uniref:DUF2071 domain-containing protein n=1 Tax=Kribbella flavida (strain DSM 17836 / JCM 10339 / NBRC 14399) TaxID=479435 RepID=D2Q0C6_KRIFD|nr:DUF2071 domain-containing protein [Kribbella flavida]ADB31918.1 conserved hypothetical protein [Kribbella flavida DSM 17836]
MAEAVSADAPALPRPRLLRQDWLDLSFLHWAVEPSAIAHHFPPGTAPDSFEGLSYVGLVPFRMANIGFPRGPALLQGFLETNVRLYSVDATGRRGVVFLSLDADRPDAVAAARSVFGLPYRWARMQHQKVDGLHTYTTDLRWPRVAASSSVTVRPGPSLTPGPFEHFLTARWGLHVARAGRTWYLPNEHPAWTLQSAELVDLQDNGLFASVGLPGLSARPPDHVAYSPGVPAVFGLPRQVP